MPIALAYHFAHYLTALLVNGQYALVALSDPFALGWNLFGTAYMPVSAGIACGPTRPGCCGTCRRRRSSPATCSRCWSRIGWRPAASGPQGSAALSQLPLVLMVGYTVFGLWLLSTPTAG